MRWDSSDTKGSSSDVLKGRKGQAPISPLFAKRALKSASWERQNKEQILKREQEDFDDEDSEGESQEEEQMGIDLEVLEK